MMVSAKSKTEQRRPSVNKGAVKAKDLKAGMKVGFMSFNPKTNKNDQWSGAVVKSAKPYVGEISVMFEGGYAMLVKPEFLFSKI